MSNLLWYEQVVQEHVCLYVYDVKSCKLLVLNDGKLIKNTINPNSPRYYIYDYSGNNNAKYLVSTNAGKVLHRGDIFRVWFAKADDSVGVKSLLDAIDSYAVEKIKNASDTIIETQKQRDLAHAILRF